VPKPFRPLSDAALQHVKKMAFRARRTDLRLESSRLLETASILGRADETGKNAEKRCGDQAGVDQALKFSQALGGSSEFKLLAETFDAKGFGQINLWRGGGGGDDPRSSGHFGKELAAVSTVWFVGLAVRSDETPSAVC
jgi:hypothetical protein